MFMRWVAGTVGVISTGALWVLVDASSMISLLVLTIYVLSPWAFLTFGATSLGTHARRVAVVLVTLMTVAMYATFAQQDSSTGALVFVFVPIYQWGIIGIAELVVRIRTTRHRDRKAPNTTKSH